MIAMRGAGLQTWGRGWTLSSWPPPPLHLARPMWAVGPSRLTWNGDTPRQFSAEPEEPPHAAPPKAEPSSDPPEDAEKLDGRDQSDAAASVHQVDLLLHMAKSDEAPTLATLDQLKPKPRKIRARVRASSSSPPPRGSPQEAEAIQRRTWQEAYDAVSQSLTLKQLRSLLREARISPRSSKGGKAPLVEAVLTKRFELVKPKDLAPGAGADGEAERAAARGAAPPAHHLDLAMPPAHLFLLVMPEGEEVRQAIQELGVGLGVGRLEDGKGAVGVRLSSDTQEALERGRTQLEEFGARVSVEDVEPMAMPSPQRLQSISRASGAFLQPSGRATRDGGGGGGGGGADGQVALAEKPSLQVHHLSSTSLAVARRMLLQHHLDVKDHGRRTLLYCISPALPTSSDLHAALPLYGLVPCAAVEPVPWLAHAGELQPSFRLQRQRGDSSAAAAAPRAAGTEACVWGEAQDAPRFDGTTSRPEVDPFALLRDQLSSAAASAGAALGTGEAAHEAGVAVAEGDEKADALCYSLEFGQLLLRPAAEGSRLRSMLHPPMRGQVALSRALGALRTGRVPEEGELEGSWGRREARNEASHGSRDVEASSMGPLRLHFLPTVSRGAVELLSRAAAAAAKAFGGSSARGGPEALVFDDKILGELYAPPRPATYATSALTRGFRREAPTLRLLNDGEAADGDGEPAVVEYECVRSVFRPQMRDVEDQALGDESRSLGAEAEARRILTRLVVERDASGVARAWREEATEADALNPDSSEGDMRLSAVHRRPLDAEAAHRLVSEHFNSQDLGASELSGDAATEGEAETNPSTPLAAPDTLEFASVTWRLQREMRVSGRRFRLGRVQQANNGGEDAKSNDVADDVDGRAASSDVGLEAGGVSGSAGVTPTQAEADGVADDVHGEGNAHVEGESSDKVVQAKDRKESDGAPSINEDRKDGADHDAAQGDATSGDGWALYCVAEAVAEAGVGTASSATSMKTSMRLEWRRELGRHSQSSATPPGGSALDLPCPSWRNDVREVLRGTVTL